MIKRIRGFTLFELLLTLGIGSVIATLGLPALGDMAARTRVRTEANALHHALHRARRESVMRNEYVSLCKTADGLRCDPGLRWDAGWMVFVDEDRDFPPQRDDGEFLVQHRQPGEAIQILANRDAFVIRTARRRTTNGSFAICDGIGRAAGLGVIVSYTGRPRTVPVGELPGRLACPSGR